MMDEDTERMYDILGDKLCKAIKEQIKEIT